jgi:hypothetical protein
MIAAFLTSNKKEALNPNSPNFWQDKMSKADEQIHKLNLLLNESDGKCRGFQEISQKRQSCIAVLEDNVNSLKDQLKFQTEKSKHLELQSENRR